MGFLHFVYPEQEWWILLLHAFFRLQKSSADRQNQRCEKLYERLQQKDEEIGQLKQTNYETNKKYRDLLVEYKKIFLLKT